MKRILHRIGLTLYFSLSIFIMHLFTFTTTGVLVYMSISFGWYNESVLEDPLIITIITLLSCIIIGTFISAIASKKMLKSVRQIIEVTDKLASGDFSARLNITHPPEYKFLSDNFNHMAEELESIEVLRKDFVNNFSHEFKTPIVSIKGFAEILKDDDLPKETRDEYLDIVIEESTRLASLATNVLNLSKIETQMILTDKQKFNVGEQLRQCVLLLDSKFDKKNILLNLDIHDYVIAGNKEMLNQVWVNLLDNCIKFSELNGIIDISIKQVHEQVMIVISDNGCGISHDALPKIFDRFYQQDTSHATMGNGLGLTIVHKIITLHKGSIQVDSALSRGTSFTISLPIDT